MSLERLPVTSGRNGPGPKREVSKTFGANISQDESIKDIPATMLKVAVH